MTDENSAGAQGEPSETGGVGPGAPSDTWDDLGRQLSDLGGAIARALRAAVDDPENRRHAQELKSGLESFAQQIGDAFEEAADTPQGRRVRDEMTKAAQSVAAAGRKVADDVRPHLIDAARSASEKLRETAATMEERSKAASGTSADDAAPEPGDGIEGKDGS